MTEILSFRVTQQQKEKLKLLAVGESTTVQKVIHKLIDLAPVEEVTRSGLALRTDSMKNKSAVSAYQGNNGAFAN